MCEDPPTECLENYDDFDLDNKRERRLATYSLEDYYGTVLSEYGREYLNLTQNDIEQNIGPQWNKAKSRIRTLDGVQIPDNYNDIINRFSTERNTEVSHDYQANPSLERVEDARRIAEEWSDWFIEHCESYSQMEEEQTAEEMVENLIGSISDSIITSEIEYFDATSQKRYEKLENKAETIRQDLNAASSDQGLGSSEGVDKKLVRILLDAVELRNDKEDLDSTYRYRKEKIERQEEIRRYENTYECIVVDDYDDHASIQVVNNEYNMPDRSYVIYADEFPEQREYLRDLDVNDTVNVEIGVDRHGEEVVRSIQ